MKAVPGRHRTERGQFLRKRGGKWYLPATDISTQNQFTCDDTARQTEELINVFVSHVSAEEVEKLKARIELGTRQQIAEMTIGSFATLSRTASEVTRLMGHYNEGVPPEGCPSDRAHVRAHQLILWLTDAGFRHGASDVYVDRDDALRLQWSSGERQVKMVFPFAVDEKPYLYHSGGEEYDVEPDPMPEQILNRLKWVFDPDQSRQLAA
jgi:hypothetical protein